MIIVINMICAYRA